MSARISNVPLYDRRRLETLVMEHKVRVHLEQKKAAKHRPGIAGVKAPR